MTERSRPRRPWTGRSPLGSPTSAALGRGFSIEERVLNSLRRCLARLPGADLDQGGFDCWCETLGISTPTPGEPAR